MDLVTRLDEWFDEQLGELGCSDDAKAYVIGVLSGFRLTTSSDMSRESVVLAFYDARMRRDFATFQRIGDWILYVSTVLPSGDRGQRDLVENFGRQSYHTCYRLLERQWPVYEELGDELPAIVHRVRGQLVVKR